MGYGAGSCKESDRTEATLARMHASILSLQLKEAKGEEKKSFPKFLVFFFNLQGCFSMTIQRR